MTDSILVVGKVVCPEGPNGQRREIALDRLQTAKLPLARFVPCPIPRKRNCGGTKVKLIANEDEYRTRFHRYAQGRFAYTSYLADGTRIMGFHLKTFLHRHGLTACDMELQMEVKGYCFRIVLPSARPSSPLQPE
jgi:hypothetical protein